MAQSGATLGANDRFLPVNAPEVSIILPTQGVRSSLAAALRSALAQTGVSLEVVVVDDAPPGSEWRGGHLLTTLLADPRVRVVPFQQARGCAAAKNAGLRAARGAWVCYLDDDNEYEPGKVRAQRELAVTTGSPVVLCGMQIRVAGRRRYRQIGVAAFAGDALLLDALADTNTLFHQRETGVWWDETLGTVDDACFFQALTTRADLSSVPNVPAPLVIYHAHPGARANRDFERLPWTALSLGALVAALQRAGAKDSLTTFFGGVHKVSRGALV